MEFKRAALPRAIVFAFGINTLCMGSTFAQDVGDDARMLDAVSVTGSRISVPGVEASSPVAAVERDEFLTTQPVAVESFLKEFPALTPSIGPGTNNGTEGGATINMRGLGDNRTLVLVDGRRPVPFNMSGVVDTNTIPMSLLQSVEMLTGGASVVYGADAVAGVTNFILRRDFEGVEFNMNRGESKYSDGVRQNYEITLGALSDDGRANAVLSVGLTKVDPVQQGARDWSVVSMDSVSGEPGGSGTTVPARINVVGAGLGTLQIDPESGALVPTYKWFNYNPLNYYQTGLDRWQITGLARYEFTPHAEAYAQVNYTRSKVASAWAEPGIFLTVIDVPLANPYLPTAMRRQICDALNIAQTNCDSRRDAAGNLIITPMGIGRRITEIGPRLYDYNTRTFQMTAGLRGHLISDWNYDTYWSYGESDQTHSIGNTLDTAKVMQAMMATTTTACIDPSNGCVPLNPFGVEGTITPDQLDFIGLTMFRMQHVEQTNAAFNLDGTLGAFKSPWAEYPIGLATGLEYRRSVAATRYDAAWLADSISARNSNGSFSIQEIYAESIIPVVSGRAGVENLSLELGYRHSEFSNAGGFDTDYGSWKYGLSWSVTETLKFRAMRQRATRAPNISELFQPEATILDNMSVDPCAGPVINPADAAIPGTLSWLCANTGVPLSAIGSLDQPSAGEVNTLRSGNLALTPEKADTTSVGLVWTPSNQLSITLDWWNIEINDAISTPLVQDVVGGCYDAERNPGYLINDMCRLIERNIQTGTFNGRESRGIGLLLSNNGFIQKTGIDLAVRFGHGLPGTLGRIQYALDLSKVTRDDFQAAPESVLRDCLGYYSTSCTPSHDWRSNLRTTWSFRDFTATVAWRYFSALEIEPLAEVNRRYFPPYRHISAYSYFDLAASLNLPWNMQVSASINNLLDKKPPLIGGDIGKTAENSGNSYPQWYDALGRYYNIGVSFKF